MKRVCVVLILATATFLLAQEKSVITVKDSSVTTGVIIIDAQAAGKNIELQCNQTSPACTQLKRGTYQMVKLPKNHGMYDCQNADIYTDSADTESGQRLGEYCLTEK
jgi:hypothetical protein